MCNDLAEAIKVLDGKKIRLFFACPTAMEDAAVNLFFPSNAFMASARSFNMFKGMLQLGLID